MEKKDLRAYNHRFNLSNSHYAIHPRPVMVVANDGRAEDFDIAGFPDLDNPSIASFNQAELLPSDPSKAYLASLPDEAWLRPIPLGVPRALTFPLLGQYNVDVNEDLVSRLACVCVFLECVC